MKAQVAVEYLMLIGMALIIALPLFYYAISESSNTIKLNQAEDAVNSIAMAADSAYSLGPGTKKYVNVVVPGGVEQSSIDGKAIKLKVSLFGSVADIYARSKANLLGGFPLTKGHHRISVEALDSGYVQINLADDTEAPIITWTYPRGTINYNGVVLRANTNEPAYCKYDLSDKTYDSMLKDFSGSALSHEGDLGILSDGNYVYYIRCRDPYNNVMDESVLINFTIVPLPEGNVTNETLEYEPPIINLVAPENDSVNNGGIVIFQYNVSDDSSIAYCGLIVDDITRVMNNSVVKDVTQAFSYVLNYGNYSWNINCTDVHGTEGYSETRDIFINFTQDLDNPDVFLEAPADNTIRDYWLIRFSYNVTDTSSGIDYCKLNLNGELEGGGIANWSIIDSPVQEETSESLTTPLFKGNYTWNMNCVDDSINNNIGYSETRNLRINLSAGEEAFIDSCAGWCGWQGLSGGICDNSENKCANNCGLPYSGSRDCYAGENVSGTYCLGGAEADTCCCIA